MIAIWKKAYRIGDAEIDAQHQTLFNKANAFLASIDDQMLDACAAAFYEYVCHHFEVEEVLMAVLMSPAFDGHVQQHREMLSQLGEILEDIADANQSKEKLVHFLNDTFPRHIAAYDAPFVAYARVT
jgi:hemerythrin-like metal-binding protein